MSLASIDVIIVSFNTRDDLAACLKSLFEHPPARLGRVFVIDNASKDGSVEMVRSAWPAVHLETLDRNLGFAAANNVGLRLTTSDYVLLLNSDTLVPAGAIDALAERLEARGAVAAGPRLVDAAGRPEMSYGSMLTPLGELRQLVRVRAAASDGALARRYIERLLADERLVDWVSGACLLVHRQAAVDVGLLDERYFMYEEDVDFCAALRAKGGKVLFTPRVTITHLRGRAMRAAGASSALYDRSHVLFYEKHAPGWAPVLRSWLRVRGRAIR